jgi:uncharacterized membrane protein
MNTEEQARELMAKNRDRNHHLHESMLNRAAEEVENGHDLETEEKARELLAQDRQHDRHLNESMLNRAVEEVG